MSPTVYATAKAVHIVGFISWFAGLFYIVRLFIYHAEASARPPEERSILLPQLELMSRRLWTIITVPASVLTIAAGLTMVVTWSPRLDAATIDKYWSRLSAPSKCSDRSL